MSSEKIRAVDLFCGAGGLSWGLVEALRDVAIDADHPTEAVLEEVIDLVGVNHWEIAIKTHEQNHPWARHYHDDVAHVNPREVFDDSDPEVAILSGGIECTHWSTARGGRPVNEQKRMPAWDVLTWVQKLRPANVLLENVKEFESWGPIDEDGQPTRSGETFDQWVNALHSLGYNVDWQVLNAADYGDATTRERLFVLARRNHTPEFPDPTHSEDGTGDTAEWRSAAEIIDWSDPGGSIWVRDLNDPRKRPLKNSTMQRIAEGIRRHCDPSLDPYARVLERMGRDDVRALRQSVVPVQYADVAAMALESPFLVHAPATPATPVRPLLRGQHTHSRAEPVTESPVPTITAASRGISLATPTTYCLRQQSGGVPSSIADPLPTISGGGAVQRVDTQALVMPRNGAHRGLHSNPLYLPEDRPLHTVTAKNTDGYLVTPALVRYSHGGASLSVDDPMPTIATERGGVYALSHPYLCPLYSSRPTQRPRTRDVDRPLMTVPGSKSPAGIATPVVRPFLDDYEGPPPGVESPIGTITSRDRFALVVPELYPWGLDVRYRMLQPRELAAAQGFPPEYEFAGNKTETTEQIGNAVPVNLARNLVASLLESHHPSLTDYLDDTILAEEPVPGGVASDD